jgi:uncharacterized repeat protein (TIGR03806 family)
VDCRGGNISHPPPRQPQNGVTANYFIPNDNPFVVAQASRLFDSNSLAGSKLQRTGKMPVPLSLEEFFCLGLRSPHRMTIDPPTGKIFIGDVGDSSREEIDVINPGESGLNFQWNFREGNLGTMPEHYLGVSRGPVLDYPHTDGRAVIGGYVYRGKEFAGDLGGKYIFGDNVFRTVWALDESSMPFKKTLLCVMPKGTGPNAGTDYTGLSSFGTDADGEIFFCQMSSVGGHIFKLQRGGPPPPKKNLPRLLSQTGAFADIASLAPAEGMLPYAVIMPLWSDGAMKTRWMALPSGTRIGFSAKGEWTFPAGTVFVKHFDLPIDDTNPHAHRRLETRLLVRDTEGYVYGASYKWRADDSDADLVTNGFTEDIAVRTAHGTRTQNWYFPGRQDCLTCHTVAAGGVLGAKTRQLNCDFKYPSGITDNQLHTLGHIGVFDGNFDDKKISRYARLANIADTGAAPEVRVRSYLDANCSHCHRPGNTGAFFDARFDTPLERQNLINGPVANLLGTPKARVISPDDLDASILFHRLNITGENQMPPLARNVVDTNAVAVVGKWILGLHPRPPELPKGWSSGDIGAVGVTGEASFLNDRFNVLGSGGDIWESADAFHFVSRPLNGDGEVIAHVMAMQYTDPWAKAGVMFRDGDSPGAKNVLFACTGQGGSVLQARTEVDGATASADGPEIKFPRWIKLSRSGEIFSAGASTDGTNWVAVGSVTNALGKTVSTGLAVSAHNNSALNSTLFEGVSVNPKAERR